MDRLIYSHWLGSPVQGGSLSRSTLGGAMLPERSETHEEPNQNGTAGLIERVHESNNQNCTASHYSHCF